LIVHAFHQQQNARASRIDVWSGDQADHAGRIDVAIGIILPHEADFMTCLWCSSQRPFAQTLVFAESGHHDRGNYLWSADD